MSLCRLSRSSLVVVTSACVVLAPVTPDAEGDGPRHVAVPYLPTAAFIPISPRSGATPMLLEDSESVAEVRSIGEAPTAVAVTGDLAPIDVINAISAAGYLLVVVPSLLFTVPFQLITGQSDAIVKSLNNIITAVNTILKLVGRSIDPIPTAQTDIDGAAALVVSRGDRAEHDDDPLPAELEAKEPEQDLAASAGVDPPQQRSDDGAPDEPSDGTGSELDTTHGNEEQDDRVEPAEERSASDELGATDDSAPDDEPGESGESGESGVDSTVGGNENTSDDDSVDGLSGSEQV